MTPEQIEALRPAFERLHPAPDGIVWCRIQQAYVQSKPHWVQIAPNEHARYQGRWEGWIAAFESLGEPNAEFCLWQGDELAASVSGPHDRALAEIQHYAAVYSQDGPVRIEQVFRLELPAPPQDNKDE